MKPWRYLKSLGVLIIFMVLQMTIIGRLGIILSQIDLLLALVMAYALMNGSREGAIFGLCTGLLRGIVAGPALGLWAIPYYIIGYSVGEFSSYIYGDSAFVLFVTGAAASTCHWLLLTLITGGFYGFWVKSFFWLSLPPVILVNSFLLILIYKILRPHMQHEGQSVGR